MRMKGASLLWWYVISLWMSSFRVSSCDYIDILRYYLYLGVLRLPVLPVCVFNVVRFDDLCLFSSSVVNLSGCDQALACTSNRTSIRSAQMRSVYGINLHCIGVFSLSSLLIPLLLSLSLFLLFSSLSCSLSLSLSLSVSVGVYIVCVFIVEVIGAVEYERSFTHCARC